jgi:DNA-binding phage protein
MGGPAIRKPRASMKRPLNTEDVVRLLRSEVERAGSQNAFAKKAGVDRATVNKILHGRLSPSPKIVHSLGLRMVFVPK